MIAVLCLGLAVSDRIADFDLWGHLAAGRTFWQLRSIPAHYLWTWPSYGEPAVVPSWLFRALLWPVWDAAGVIGLYGWRWITTLLAFGLLWATARRIGGHGLAVALPLVACSLLYRQRSQVRPETLAAVLLALTLWILETRRAGGRDRSPWLVLVLWIWANAHVSYPLGFLLLGVFTVEAWIARRNPARSLAKDGTTTRGPGRLLGVGIAALALCFVNPYGAEALASPFRFFLFWRHEPLFQLIEELQPTRWGSNWISGAPVLVAAWPALLIARAARRGIDRAEIALLVLFTALAFGASRFLGFYALVAAPYLARDLADLIARFDRARRSGPAWGRAAIVSVACVAICLPTWTLSHPRLGIGTDLTGFPIAAANFMTAHGVRGRAYNSFHFGGYLQFRFWPDRSRLPFMDAHQEIATPDDRRLYALALFQENAWKELDRRHRFDYVLVARDSREGNRLLDHLDADTSLALVFVDDASALYVKRGSALDGVAARMRYRWLPAGAARTPLLLERCLTDSAACAEIAAELERATAESPFHSEPQSLLANTRLVAGRWAEARRHLDRALAIDPDVALAHERLALIALEEGRPLDAVRELGLERRANPSRAGLDYRIGMALQRAGDLEGARAAYRRELRRNPVHLEALDSLSALDARSPHP